MSEEIVIKDKTGIEFYNLVSTTDPKAVKKVKSGGRDYDSVDAYYLIKKATKHFGLMGSWGLKDTKHESITIGDTVLLNINAVFYYPGGEFEISNAVKLSYKTNGANGYIKTDEDAYKKLHTNTLSKALSYIGFATDIFENKFSDQNYLNEMFGEHELCDPTRQQNIRKQLGYYKVNAADINKHFIISTLTDLKAADYEEAMALIKQLGEEQKKSEGK